MDGRNALGLAVDLGLGLLLAGIVAPLALVVLPPALHGRAFLLVVCGICVGAAHAFRRVASG